MTTLADDIGRQILRILQEDGRISFNELGRKVGLSSPAVAERVRRMEEAGIILGYRAIVDQSRVGYPIMAFVRLSIPVSFLAQADELAKSIPEVLECHHLTGSDGVILKHQQNGKLRHDDHGDSPVVPGSLAPDRPGKTAGGRPAAVKKQKAAQRRKALCVGDKKAAEGNEKPPRL